MVNLNGGPPNKGFIQPSGSKGSGQSKSLRSRDIVALLAVVVSLLLVIACMVYIDGQAQGTNFIDKGKPKHNQLKKMSAPDLEQLPTLPNKQMLSDLEERASWVIKNPQELKDRFNGYSKSSFAWLRLQIKEDKQNPPLPQYFDLMDIFIDGLDFATPTVIDGLVINSKTVSIDGLDEQWQWVLIEAEANQFLMVLAPAETDAYTIGNKAKIIGRSMGLMRSPGNEGEFVHVIGARNIIELTEAVKVKLPNPAPELGKVTEEELFADIDDERAILELQPYFYLLGKINQIDSYDENVYEDAVWANPISGKIHDAPSKYRGQAFHIKGRVLDIYEDVSVEKYKPYNIDNVTRIIIWDLVREGFKTENTFSKEVTENVETVRHAYELAVVGKVPPLKKGQMIRASGRFLKVHGIPMDKSTNRDAVFGTLNSKNFYSKFFVVPDIHIIEEPEESMWVKVALTVVMASFFLCVLWLYVNDVKSSETYRTRNRRRMSKSSAEKANNEKTDTDTQATSDSTAHDANE